MSEPAGAVLMPMYNVPYETTLRVSAAEIEDALRGLEQTYIPEWSIDIYPESFVISYSRVEGRRRVRTHIPYEVIAQAWAALLGLDMLRAAPLDYLSNEELRTIVQTAARRVDLGVGRADD